MTTRLEFTGYSSAPRFFINSVWGGPDTSGHIIAHFLFKHTTPPEYTMMDSQTGRVLEQDGVIEVQEVQLTLIIPPHEAKSIGEWMIRHAKSVLEAVSGLPNDATMQ